jgi:hypothetical protein
MSTIPARSENGCYHPSTEEELAVLVKHARDAGKQLRVMGSTHSVWKAIVTDNFAGSATPDSEITVVLDRYTKVFEVQPGNLVEVQAGCHVGLSPTRPVQARIIERPADSDIRQPSPWHEGSWEKSLTSVLHHRDGLALPDLGGISHQTVAGFISTGSAGGTVKWSVHEAIVKLRVIDGNGDVKELTRTGADADWFRAAGIGMGLCGVISTITFQCIPTFDIVGTETISNTALSDDMDFYGDRPGSGLPSLEKFLVDTDYCRLMWWPQKNFDRLVVWQAHRAPFDANRKLNPYEEIAHFPVASQVAASVVYTVLGHLEEPEAAVEHLLHLRASITSVDWKGIGDWLRRFVIPPIDPSYPDEPQKLFPWISAIYELIKGERHSPITLGAAWIVLVEFLVTTSDDILAFALKLPILRELFKKLGTLVPAHIDTVLGLFVNTGKDGTPATQEFCDRGFMGLPMDNQMDDLLMPTWFTEIWVPFTPGDGKLQESIKLLRKHFDADGTDEGAYAATGAFSYELYVGKKDDTFFLSPATGTHVFRIDVFWFGKNAGDPVKGFYKQFWELLEPLNYRLHWGKFLPAPDPAKPDQLTRQYPDWAKWKAVRARVDPKNIFLTKYWKDQLGL